MNVNVTQICNKPMLKKKRVNGRASKRPFVELARRGIALEENGERSEEAAKQCGLDWRSYSVARDVTMFYDGRNELPSDDRVIVMEAMEALEAGWPGKAEKLIRPIVIRTIGKRAQRIAKPGSRISPERRLMQFDTGIRFVQHACESVTRITIPAEITAEHLETTIHQIKDSMQSLKTLRRLIGRTWASKKKERKL